MATNLFESLVELCGLEIKVLEDHKNSVHEEGYVVWNSSKTLFRWIVEHLSITTWSTIRILELGSGCGLLAQALSMQGAEVIATDKQPILELLRQNIHLNMEKIEECGGKISTRELEWREDIALDELNSILGTTNFNLVVGSELMYSGGITSTYKPLLTVISCVLGSSKVTKVNTDIFDPTIDVSSHLPCAILCNEWHFGFEDLFVEEATQMGLRCFTLEEIGPFKILMLIH